jgi:hypothetical protein
LRTGEGSAMPDILAHFWSLLSHILSAVTTRLILAWMLGQAAVADRDW